MIIKSIKLTNFRNHSTYFLDCNKTTSLILGPNGSGKTSVLEAIYLLTRGKSFRATDKEIIKTDADFYRAELEYVGGETSVVVYDRNNKTFLIEGRKSRRLPKKNHYPVILFEPSDLNLISHSPSRRRTYFDRIFSEFNPAYATALSRYDKALRQRNQLLKNLDFRPADLFSWDLLLAKYGIDLHHFRQTLIAELNAHLTDSYRSISNQDDTISIDYETKLSSASPENSSTNQHYLEILGQNLERDRALGHTSFGVHHDDYLFTFNHKIADGSASRGESRTIILALKFIEADLLYQKTGLRPLILLDDVFSELDVTRRRSLIHNFQDHQIILTSVEEVNLDQDMI